MVFPNCYVIIMLCNGCNSAVMIIFVRLILNQGEIRGAAYMDIHRKDSCKTGTDLTQDL